MIRMTIVAACLPLLGACATLDRDGVPSQVLSNLEGCKRSYTGSTTPVPAMSFHIECEPRPPIQAPSP